MSATFALAVSPSVSSTRGTCIRATRSAPSSVFAYASGSRCWADAVRLRAKAAMLRRQGLNLEVIRRCYVSCPAPYPAYVAYLGVRGVPGVRRPPRSPRADRRWPIADEPPPLTGRKIRRVP